MQEQYLTQLLAQVRDSHLSVAEAMELLRDFPMQMLDSAQLDHQRSLRTGLPEAVLAEHKSIEQLLEILNALLQKPTVVLATRVDPHKAAQVQAALPALRYHAQARMLTAGETHIPQQAGRGTVVLVSAGSSDLPVAEEARVTLEYLGHAVHSIHDVGVAGIHRILAQRTHLRSAAVVIAVAGMDGALPSVVAGLTAAPVIGLPCSVGYGTGTGGFAALFAMLNSCSPGLAVVNIDNGFGAACMAAAINRRG